jgi:hypothetical protein
VVLSSTELVQFLFDGSRIVQSGRSQVRFSNEVIRSVNRRNPNPFSHTVVVGSTQLLMNTRNVSRAKADPDVS